MGDYQKALFEEQLEKRFKENEKFKIIDVIKLFNIPLLTVKQSDFTKVYLLFSSIPVFKIINYGGFN